MKTKHSGGTSHHKILRFCSRCLAKFYCKCCGSAHPCNAVKSLCTVVLRAQLCQIIVDTVVLCTQRGQIIVNTVVLRIPHCQIIVNTMALRTQRCQIGLPFSSPLILFLAPLTFFPLKGHQLFPPLNYLFPP